MVWSTIHYFINIFKHGIFVILFGDLYEHIGVMFVVLYGPGTGSSTNQQLMLVLFGFDIELTLLKMMIVV
ncbi:hypothetical protein GCM10009647_068560 [Streptomyces sanglieri]